MKDINTPWQAMDSGGVASHCAPSGAVSQLAFSALARQCKQAFVPCTRSAMGPCMDPLPSLRLEMDQKEAPLPSLHWKMSGYKTLLRTSAHKVGNCACMGLDPQWDVLPYRSGHIREDLTRFFTELLQEMGSRGLSPAAFKPNIGYYHALDNPREGGFEGSLALADLLTALEEQFTGIPVILDSKRGDIARSSANYAHEAFDVWRCDAVTASPYMGTDSVAPFDDNHEGSRGIYLLNRTSNPGAKDLQGLVVVDEVDEKELYPLYIAVGHRIGRWAEKIEGIGAVVGATNLEELQQIARYHGERSIPLLIPGVGSQGGSARMTMKALREVGYPVELARINSSSALTHPWKKAPAPSNWIERCMANIENLCEETAL